MNFTSLRYDQYLPVANQQHYIGETYFLLQNTKVNGSAQIVLFTLLFCKLNFFIKIRCLFH